mgnify:CR=1 FL=1
MAGKRGPFGKVVFYSITAFFLYVAGYVLLKSLTEEGQSLIGAALVIIPMWIVYSWVMRLIIFALGSDEMSYEELKENMRQRGDHVIEEDMPLPSNLLGESTGQGGRGVTSKPGGSNKPPRSGGNEPQARMWVGSERQDKNEVLDDFIDMFRHS